MKSALSATLGTLAVAVVVLFMPPALAVTDTGASDTTLLGSFDGLANVFRRLQGRIESCYSRPSEVRMALGSPAAYQRVLSGRSAAGEKRLRLGHAQAVGLWQQFVAVATQVLGDETSLQAMTYAQAYAAFGAGDAVMVQARQGAATRDRVVGRMHILGYTPREIVDVVSGAISLKALQQADRMRTLGYTGETIAGFLERQYKRPPFSTNAPVHSALRAPSTGARWKAALPTSRTASGRSEMEELVTRYASAYDIDPDLIRAVITHESSWRPQVRSPAGAVGLMQLMPATAEMLGVDPLDPAQNIEGGVRYLAGLLAMFGGDLDTALVAYNAGPAYARKWRQGDTVLYGETRDYLHRVKRTYASR